MRCNRSGRPAHAAMCTRLGSSGSATECAADDERGAALAWVLFPWAPLEESMSRTGEQVISLDEIRARLIQWRDQQEHRDQLYSASFVAQVIWPQSSFLSAQGALGLQGAPASGLTVAAPRPQLGLEHRGPLRLLAAQKVL